MVEAGVTPASLNWDYVCLVTARRLIKGASFIENPAVDVIKYGRARRVRSLAGVVRGSSKVSRVVALICDCCETYHLC